MFCLGEDDDFIENVCDILDIDYEKWLKTKNKGLDYDNNDEA